MIAMAELEKWYKIMYSMFYWQTSADLTNAKKDGTYDAYKEDIAIATFYFEEPIIFEYTRHV